MLHTIAQTVAKLLYTYAGSVLNYLICVLQVDLLRKMMTYEPADRITAVQALQHQFFNPQDAAEPAGTNGSAAAKAAKRSRPEKLYSSDSSEDGGPLATSR